MKNTKSKRKSLLLVGLICALMLSMSLVMLTGCNGYGNGEPTQLATPTTLAFNAVNNTASWGAVENAATFEVEFRTQPGNVRIGEIVSSTTASIVVPSAVLDTEIFNFRVRALSAADANFTASNWSTAFLVDLTVVPAEFDVSFTTHGGSAVTTLTGVSSIAAEPVTTRAYYQFAGWFGSAADAAAHSNRLVFPLAVTAHRTLHAAWTRIAFNVAFTVNGGSAVTAQNNVSVIETEPVTTRAHHQFAGWFATAADATAQTNRLVFPFTVTANMTLYAAWTQTAFNVTFNTGGGSAVTAQNGITTIASEPVTTRANHQFAGWFGSAADAASQSGRLQFPLAIDGNRTLFAAWNPSTFNVNFNTRGGTAVDGLTNVSTVAVAPTAPTHGNYRFAGWFTTEALAEAATTAPVDFPWSPSNFVHGSTHTLFAGWQVLADDVELPNRVRLLLGLSPAARVDTVSPTFTPPNAFATVTWTIDGEGVTVSPATTQGTAPITVTAAADATVGVRTLTATIGTNIYATMAVSVEDFSDEALSIPISTPAQWNWLSLHRDRNFHLTNDINFGGATVASANPALGWPFPYANNATAFIGTLDGRGHTISNFSTPHLFGVLGFNGAHPGEEARSSPHAFGRAHVRAGGNGVIQNLRIYNATHTGGAQTGLLVSRNFGLIRNVIIENSRINAPGGEAAWSTSGVFAGAQEGLGQIDDSLSINNTAVGDDGRVGGFVGGYGHHVENSFMTYVGSAPGNQHFGSGRYPDEPTGMSGPGGFRAANVAALLQGANFSTLDPAVWNIVPGELPTLKVFISITTPYEFMAMTLEGNYVLDNHIDFAGVDFNPIGMNGWMAASDLYSWDAAGEGVRAQRGLAAPDVGMIGGTAYYFPGQWAIPQRARYAFRGVFNGRGFALRNITIIPPASVDGAAMQHLGIFRFTRGATITNVSIENITINAMAPEGGFLVGVASDTLIENVFIEGARIGFAVEALAAHHFNAGLAGLALHGSVIRNIVIVPTTTAPQWFHVTRGVGQQWWGNGFPATTIQNIFVVTDGVDITGTVAEASIFVGEQVGFVLPAEEARNWNAFEMDEAENQSFGALFGTPTVFWVVGEDYLPRISPTGEAVEAPPPPPDPVFVPSYFGITSIDPNQEFTITGLPMATEGSFTMVSPALAPGDPFTTFSTAAAFTEAQRRAFNYFEVTVTNNHTAPARLRFDFGDDDTWFIETGLTTVPAGGYVNIRVAMVGTMTGWPLQDTWLGQIELNISRVGFFINPSWETRVETVNLTFSNIRFLTEVEPDNGD